VRQLRDERAGTPSAFDALASGMESALGESERRWQALADLSADWYWECDRQHRLSWLSGAAPQALADHMALSIDEALPRVVDALIETGLRQRVRVVASGKLITSARAAWALAAGADFVNTARGFMFALGCIQALRCHANTCPAGVTTHNPRLQRGLVVADKAERVAHYCRNMNKEIDMIAHSCGLRHAREFRREHVRIVQGFGQSIAFNMLYPYPAAG